LQEIEVQIERMSFGPAAVGRVRLPGEDRALVVFVEGAAPGELVRARVTRKDKNYWEAKLVEILRRSPDRIEPPCPVFGRCGGCQWQHLDYAAQVRAKEEILLHQLQRATRLEPEALRAKLTAHPAKNPFGYRTRLQVHGNRRGIGFFAPGSHEVVPTHECLVAHPDIRRAWAEFAAHRPLGELSRATGGFKVEWTRTDSGQVMEAINRKHGAFGFTQVNAEQNAELVRVVTELAGTGDVLLDLYGGDGNLSERLLDRFPKILSVDSFNRGIDPTTASPGAGRTFIRQDVEAFLVERRLPEWGIDRVDCVIADPPRNGLRGTSSLISGLKAPRIILVSCDPATLSRDLSVLLGPYSVDRIHLIDMFPQTYHMETVVLLTAGS
jgi:23S rRNA (uracil1939-C5)-methyltransferase